MTDDQLASTVLSALGSVRLSLQAEHADIEFVRLDRGVAELRLAMTPETCSDCVMPRDYLESVILSVLRERMPRVEKVHLDDPRERAHHTR